MAIDLFILGLIVVFGLMGAATGAARQIGQLIGLVAAFAVAGPLGKAAGPWMSRSLGQVPLGVGTVAATMSIFIVVWVGLRWVSAAIIRQAMSGDDPDDRSVDRNLGMLISVVKVSAATYVLVSALVFAEQNITTFGRKMGFSPKDSIAFDIARRYNLFEMTQFAQVRDLIRVANAATDPKQMDKLQKDPAYLALQKDPRWKKLWSDSELKKAMEHGDVQSLLKSEVVSKLLEDAAITKQLEAVAGAAER